jgi:4-hydroxy-2-oxoheptanedioate aldolase
MPKIGLWSMLGNCTVLGALAASGCDFVGLDAQHGVVGVSELAACLQVLAARGVPSIVRVMSTGDPLFAHALDFGAGAVLVPMVRGAGDLEDAVLRSRLQPSGTRSVVGETFNGSGNWPWGSEAESGGTTIWGMLETCEAVEHLEEILAVDGLGGLFMGPSDLALAHGLVPGSVEAVELVVSVGKTLVDMAEGAGRATGLFVKESAEVAGAAAAGFGYVVVGSDLGWLERRAAEQLLEARASRPVGDTDVGRKGT